MPDTYQPLEFYYEERKWSEVEDRGNVLSVLPTALTASEYHVNRCPAISCHTSQILAFSVFIPFRVGPGLLRGEFLSALSRLRARSTLRSSFPVAGGWRDIGLGIEPWALPASGEKFRAITSQNDADNSTQRAPARPWNKIPNPQISQIRTERANVLYVRCMTRVRTRRSWMSEI